MILEAIETPIHYRWPEGEICLIPGQPVDVSAERGKKILKKCGAKVRVVAPFVVGDWVEFNSPIYGVCTGQVVMTKGEDVVVSNHSETGIETWIKGKWVTRTLERV